MASSSESELRQRLLPESDAQRDEELSFADLPYSGKVYMARKKKPDPLYVRVLEVRTRAELLSRAKKCRGIHVCTNRFVTHCVDFV